MELHQLQYAMEVAKQKNFTRAADKINVSQSTLSHQIAKLETELGIKLFERKSRTVRLTQGGEDFLGHVNLLLSNLENAKQCIQTYRGLLTGTLKIGMIAALGSLDYANMVADFYTQHPGIKFEFVQAGTYALLDKLSNREIEIAFVVRPEEHEYKDIQFRHLVYDDYVLALPMNHRLAGRTSVDLAEIADERFIFHPASDRMFSICLQACNHAGFQPNIVCESNHTPTCLALISAGMGIGFFPREKLENERFATVVVRLNQAMKKDIVLAVNKEAAFSPVAAEFNRFVTQWAKGLQHPAD
ncbi:MAG: LysR family transcriptional regulator [Veillonellaceae bacterium]|jgi:DNA-binding transcriptional LysR family regulator|nr:LysR family transcriptional regulator [Veillonellaceae bacterium]